MYVNTTASGSYGRFDHIGATVAPIQPYAPDVWRVASIATSLLAATAVMAATASILAHVRHSHRGQQARHLIARLLIAPSAMAVASAVAVSAPATAPYAVAVRMPCCALALTAFTLLMLERSGTVDVVPTCKHGALCCKEASPTFSTLDAYCGVTQALVVTPLLALVMVVVALCGAAYKWVVVVVLECSAFHASLCLAVYCVLALHRSLAHRMHWSAAACVVAATLGVTTPSAVLHLACPERPWIAETVVAVASCGGTLATAAAFHTKRFVTTAVGTTSSTVASVLRDAVSPLRIASELRVYREAIRPRLIQGSPPLRATLSLSIDEEDL